MLPDTSEVVSVLLGFDPTQGAQSCGRVDVLYNGAWGTVCDSSWTEDDAKVFCKQLGFTYGVTHPDSSSTTSLWMFDVECDGSETTLTECQYGGVQKISECSSGLAGVCCSVFLFRYYDLCTRKKYGCLRD